MSALKDMVTGGADCSGSNNPLAKLMPQIAGAAAMRENQGMHGGHSGEQGFRSMQMADESQRMFELESQGPLMHMSDLGNAIEGMPMPMHNEMIPQSSFRQNHNFSNEFMHMNQGKHSNEMLLHHEKNMNALSNQRSFSQNDLWSQEFSTFSNKQVSGPALHSPGMGMQYHSRPFMPMMSQSGPVRSQEVSSSNTMNNEQWAASFEEALSRTKNKDSVEMDDMARTAGMLLESIDSEKNQKFKDSSFLNLMKGFRDGEVKVQGNKIVPTGQSTDASQELSSVTNVNIKEQTAHILDHKDLAQNWTEEFIENQELDRNETKTTLGELSDNEFEQAFKFTNWVDEYKDHILNMTKDPKELNWDELQKDWEQYDVTGKGYRSTNPLYDNYEFSKTNPFIGAPLHVIESAINNLELSEALLALEAKVQETPEDASAWHKLGIRQQQNERESAAIAALRQAVTLDPSLCDAWLALSVSYTNDNCLPDAYDALESWIGNNPRYKHLLNGRQFNDKQRHENIFNLFLEAVHSSQDYSLDPEVQIGLGVLLNISEEYEKAVDCFQTALSTRPDDYLLWNKLGATLANSQEPTKAIDAYFRALELNPTYIRARYNLAISSINLGQYQEATEHLLSALALQLQEREASLPAEIGGSLHLPHEVSKASSSHVWDTLRMTLYMLDRPDLVEKCDVKDLNAFRDEFTF